MRNFVSVAVGLGLACAPMPVLAKQPEYHGGWKMTWDKQACTISKSVPQGTVSVMMDGEDETFITYTKAGWTAPAVGTSVKINMSDFKTVEEVKVLKASGNSMTVSLPITSWQGMMTSDTATVWLPDGSRHDFSIGKPKVAIRALADCSLWEVQGGPNY